MGEPFLAEIKFIPAPAVPEGWARCDGREMCIAEHPALFELLGTSFGGDGRSTFALPNLVGRRPVQIELHAEMLSIANQSSRPLGLERRVQPQSAAPTYESTDFCIALKGVFPLSNKP
ncbi:phage tail protein [Dyadobacter psychrophilus]|uniref:Phage Tail Collar Domain n=1 Tax=Dyadobacter psychrophilus TaxID=651661 RepID=A0A1T5BTI6_9BACT|nr:tail fiber protein [Dyadobacter psychrophilus]SKB50200.1 Phage Tail Collar Domain [Dyadobacter psychrophilus]